MRREFLFSVVIATVLSSVSGGTVWIPAEDAVDTDGSVTDEFTEVAHVFARPDNKILKPREEDEITQQSVPWTSLKNEWSIYKKIQNSERKKGKAPPQSEVQQRDDEMNDETSSEEDEDADEEEEEAARSDATARKDSGTIPLAFFGQQNHDDDEKEYLKNEAKDFRKKKPDAKDESDEESAEDDAEVDAEVDSDAAEEEEGDYADYAVDDDDDDKKKKRPLQQPKKPKFEDIPLAIREMILNDLANQNNGTFTPNLTPKVSGKVPIRPNGPIKQSSDESGSSEEDDVVPAPKPLDLSANDPDPTPPGGLVRVKGDSAESDQPQSSGGKGKGKGKKKKKGKKSGGWGWKPKGWGHVHIPAKGWGWDPEKHDGFLEQLVRGSTWERVLKYYHWKRDQALHDDDGHHGHGGGHGGHGGVFYGGPQPEGGWGWSEDGTIKKVVKHAFKGSFWERAVNTYANYKENQAKNPKKPTVIDYDPGHGFSQHEH